MDESPRVPGYTQHEYGDRIGATARLRIGAAAAVIHGNRLLLTRVESRVVWEEDFTPIWVQNPPQSGSSAA